MGLNEEELKRYDRQMMMEGWGEETQEKIKDSTVSFKTFKGFRDPECPACGQA